MLHLGLIILLLGVFMSENIVYETNAGYLTDQLNEVAPGIFVRVDDIDLQYFIDETNFNMVVTINILQNTTQGWRIIGVGYTTVTGHPDWNMVSHTVYLDSNAFRDVFIAVTGFSQIIPGVYQVTIHTKILPFISLVWIGAFLMVSAMLPMFGMEFQSILKSLRGKEQHLYEDEDNEDSEMTQDMISEN